MSRDFIRLRLSCFDHRILGRSVERIISTVKSTGARIRGPIPLPTRIERFTVLRSPHIDKKSREHFEVRTHNRVLDIIDWTPLTMETLGNLSLPAGVAVDIKV